MKRSILTTVFAAAMLMAAPAFAQDAPPPEWQGEGAIGAGVTTGNTKTSDASASLKLKHNGGVWTQSGELLAEYGKTNGIETKNRYFLAGQVDRIINDRLSGYGRATYESDKFSGFETRTFVGLGLAYKVIDNDIAKWTVQGGPGWRQDKLRPAGVKTDSLGFAAGSRYSRKLNERVAVTDDTDVIYSETSTQITNSLGVTFDISGNLSGRVSYDVRHDTDPPLGFNKTDTATRFSLVYKIG